MKCCGGELHSMAPVPELTRETIVERWFYLGMFVNSEWCDAEVLTFFQGLWGTGTHCSGSEARSRDALEGEGHHWGHHS